jgi:peroxiredoxin
MSVPEIGRLHRDYAGKGVEVVSVSVDDRIDKVQKFAAEQHTEHRQLFAGGSDVAYRYGVRGIPMFVIIDKEGRIRQIWTGFTEDMPSEWRSVLDSLLKS